VCVRMASGAHGKDEAPLQLSQRYATDSTSLAEDDSVVDGAHHVVYRVQRWRRRQVVWGAYASRTPIWPADSESTCDVTALWSLESRW
jgi:hypothetical protein